MNPTALISTIIGGINFSFIKISLLSFTGYKLGYVPSINHARNMIMAIMNNTDETIRYFNISTSNENVTQQRGFFGNILKSS